MTSEIKYGASSARFTETTSFGTHRNTDRPASALQNGASALPPAFHSPSHTHRSDPYGSEVRSLVDLALDPLRWMMASRPRAVIGGLGLVGLLAYLIG